MELREPTAADGDRIAEVVDSAMTASYRLSPQQIERVTEQHFDGSAPADRAGSDDAVARVAVTEAGDTDDAHEPDVDDPLVVGYVEGTLEGDRGVLRWLFVDPEHRGTGLGEQLFEAGRGALAEAGADEIRATTLEANAEGEDFFESFGLERVDDRRVEVGDETLVEYVYAPPEADADPTDQAGDQPRKAADAGEMDLPDTETTDGERTATTDDGETVYVALDERESGTQAPFFATYTDRDRSEQYGYYCSNCGSLDVAMDTVERMECRECGNDHAGRTGEYDDSYL